MKRALPFLIAGMILLAFVATLVFLWSRSQEEVVEVETTSPFYADIVKKTVATGAIVPRNEVLIRPRVSGIVDKISVEPGQIVERGDLLVTIRVVPDSGSLSRAEAEVRSARIRLDEARTELGRAEGLAAQGALARAELDQAKTRFQLAEQDSFAALENLKIVKEGASLNAQNVSTEVRSTVAGMVLDVPVKEGESVIEANTFNEGTTIASVADMNDLIFEGRVDESEVGKIREGLELDITVGALQEERFKGALEYISPKGVLTQGAVQFEIKAAIVPKDGVFIRAGSSANADIVLDKRQEVLSIPESALRFEGEATYVEVETAPQVFERRDVQTGLSDGINIEITGGLDKDVRIKKQEG